MIILDIYFTYSAFCIETMRRPLISIITVVYNANTTLEATLQNVLSQNKALFEYWIIDGGSTDGSVDIIKKYSDQLAGWVSEPDKGIFDAMNKGIDRATGDWLYFLGADDLLTKDILYKVSTYLKPDLVAVYGKIITDTGHTMRSHVGIRCLLENRLHHQGTFYHRNLFKEFRYVQKFNIAADYEITLRIYLQRLPTQYVPYTIAIFAIGGNSHELTSYDVNTIRGLYLKSPVVNDLLSFTLNTYYAYVRTRVKLTRTLRKVFKIEKKKPLLDQLL